MVNRRRGKTLALWTSAASRRLLRLAGHAGDISKAVEVVAARFLEGVPCPPTDLEALGGRLGILRFEAEPLPISGELRREAGGFVVTYSTFLSPPRRRFTIAHEMGHAIFECTGPNCPRSGKELERLCDMLATELLMPRQAFLRESGGADNLSWRKIDELAHLFRTSLSATSLRCAELLGATIFEVNAQSIIWAYGSIRKGPIAKLDDEVRCAIEKTRSREPIDENIFASTDSGACREWRVDGKLIGQDGRVLIMMMPKGR
jgi:hypothetical protein